MVQEFELLRGKVKGALLIPGAPGYDEARRIWNAMIDRRPACIVQCTSAEDVRQTVLFARERRMPLSVRGGGHNIAGSAVCDNGVMIDMSRFKAVEVDVARRRARVQPGATLGDLDKATQAHGLATPLGINSTTGVAGLTLGGGFGWLSRKYGLTIDNLVSAEVVTAEGKILRASSEENPDLFWALRGGGGNFGVVTSFEFNLHPVGPELLMGLMVYPLADAKSVLMGYRKVVSRAPEDLSCWVVMRKAPPLPFLPPQVHGQGVVVLAALYAGAVEEGRRALEPLRHLGTLHGEVVGPQPYQDFQKTFDPLLAFGARNYWKSNDFAELTDAAIDVLVQQAGKLPGPHCEVFLGQLGGAVQRVPPQATAYADRGAAFVLNVHARWDDAKSDEACIAWARETYQVTAPHSTGGVYVNFLTQDEANRVSAAYGPNHARLAAIKKKLDPTNLFRANQNILPEG